MEPDGSTLPMKQRMIEALERLPDSATFDDVIEHLRFVFSVEVGLAQADQGMVVSHEEAKKIIRSWLK